MSREAVGGLVEQHRGLAGRKGQSQSQSQKKNGQEKLGVGVGGGGWKHREEMALHPDSVTENKDSLFLSLLMETRGCCCCCLQQSVWTPDETANST